MKESLLTSGRGLNNSTGQPRLAGDILSMMLHSDSPLAKGYRMHLASIEHCAEKGGEG